MDFCPKKDPIKQKMSSLKFSSLKIYENIYFVYGWPEVLNQENISDTPKKYIPLPLEKRQNFVYLQKLSNP